MLITLTLKKKLLEKQVKAQTVQATALEKHGNSMFLYLLSNSLTVGLNPPVLWPHSHSSAQSAALNLYLAVSLLCCCRQHQFEKFRAWNLITIHMLSNLVGKIKS